MKHIIDALHRAAAETTDFVTADARNHARKSGWDEKAVRTTRAEYSDGEFTLKASGDAAFVHEYGDQDHSPTAALRKYSKSSPAVEAALAANLEKHLKGLL